LIDPVFAPLVALTLLQVKHLICDFFLQTSNQIENKGTYGHPGGMIHAGIHAIGTVPVFWVYPTAFVPAAIILLVEFATHYHIDWLKNVIGRHYGWTTHDKEYWWAMGVDQFLHQMTYLAIVFVLIVV
jgi:hypothetical protein